MAEHKIRLEIALSEKTVEKMTKLSNEFRIERDAVIEMAIEYFYNSNESTGEKRNSVESVASGIAMSLLQQTLDEGRSIKIPSLGITIGLREEE